MSRSIIEDKYCLPFVIARNNTGNKASNFYHWQARVACDSLNSPAPIRAWHDQKLRKNIENSIYYKAIKAQLRCAVTFPPNLGRLLQNVFTRFLRQKGYTTPAEDGGIDWQQR